MPGESHHHRREHIRENPSGTISPVSETVVRNSGPRSGKSRHEVAAQHDGLIGLINAEEEEVFDGAADDVANQLIEREASAKLLNRLMGQNVVDSQGRPLDEEAARLLTIKSLIETLEIEMQDDGDVDDIVFSLESSDWSSRGFNRKDHLPWAALGMGPEEASRWRDADFTPYNVDEWFGSRWYGRVEPEDAKYFAAAGVSFDDARQWVYRAFTGEDAVEWIKEKVSLSTAVQWLSAGVSTVQEYKEWQEIGVYQPQDVAVLKKLGSEAAERWEEAEVDLHDAARWNHLVKPGYSERDLAPFANKDIMLNPEVVEEWQKENIPADQMDEFIDKGYTPKRAASRIKKGVAADKADDLKSGELVPGKAWKEFKGSVASVAAARGYKADYSKHRRADGTLVVEVAIAPSTDDGLGYRRGSHYSFYFSNTGRFVKATGSNIWRGSIRKASEMVSHINNNT